MSQLLEEACCARLPLASLPVLAALRRLSDLTVTVPGDVAWLRWPVGAGEITRAVMTVPGVVLFVRRDGEWYRFGSRLPATDVPDVEQGRPISNLIVPAPFQAAQPNDAPLRPASLRLVRSAEARETTAVLCTLAQLAAWADGVSTVRLAAIRVARAGEEVLLLGRGLPMFGRGERFWGDRVLAPLGWWLKPALPESAILAALGADGDAVVLLREDGPEVVSGEAFQSLTRAGLRLAGEER